MASLRPPAGAMSGLDIQLLHFTSCFAIRCFTSMAITETQERGQWPLPSPQQSPAGKLLKDALEDVRSGFVRKVGGLLTAQLLLTAATSALFCSLPEALVHHWARWAIPLTFAGILALAFRPWLVRRHPSDLVCLFGLTASQAALIAPAVAACRLGDLLAVAVATIAIFAMFAFIERVSRSEVALFEPHLFAGMLTLYPWGFLLVLMVVFQVPVSPLAQAAYDVLSASSVALCALADVRHVLGGASTGRRFGVDSAGLAAIALHHGVMHLFLKLMCLSISASRVGQQLTAAHAEL